ncbi:adenine deaminase [Nonomuraea longicatena]|uniref:adenine deaminase n=1 Tax=Nonomuraea longicatena TaxID=83682 RepID=UPI0031D1EBB8
MSVHTGQTRRAEVMISGARIRALASPGTVVESPEVIDGTGLLVAPGYIDAHMHIESSLLTPAEFARITLPRGTTTVLADPHEIVNVVGPDGMSWMMEQGRTTAQTMLWAAPSCVPALDGFETSGARLTVADIADLLSRDGVRTLGEVMDYRGVVSGDPRTMEIVRAARRLGVRLDGHCPNLSGDDLNEYLWAGIDSDHTKNRTAVAVEKAGLGMVLMLQEKSLSAELVSALQRLPVLPEFCLVTDDIAADSIMDRGHLDHIARLALEAGMAPLTVLRSLSLHPARRLGLDDRGAVAPGRRADLVLLRNLTDFTPVAVVCGGRLVRRQEGAATLNPFGASVNLSALTGPDPVWRVELPDGEHVFRSIQVNAEDTYTVPGTVTLPVRDGVVRWEGRTALMAVYERHRRSGRHAMVPVTGFELGTGAVATSYAHDSHNVTVVGTDARLMRSAANWVIGAHGGICVARGGREPVRLPLPVAGVMSDRPAEEVADGVRRVREALHAWGWRHRNVLMSVATLTLPVSPQIKLTDRGLVRVTDRSWEPAVVSAAPGAAGP